MMRLLSLAFQRGTAIPMFALIFASATSVSLIAVRIAWTSRIQYAFLIWNLFLAWLPLVFALLAHDEFRQGSTRSWRLLGWSAAWLLFFPNAPYIFTDLIHLTTKFYPHFWVDLVLILLCAFTGLVLGFVSLFLMQSMVANRFGAFAGWGFIMAVAGLSGFGISVGRFLRFNSWDVVFKPLELYREIGNWMANPFGQPGTLAFPVLFSTFLFITYLMLYALTHLQQMQPTQWRANHSPSAAPRPT